MSVANHRCAFRPVHGGTLIFQVDSREAGTLGMVVTADGTDRWLLTCEHVIARQNHALVATDILVQPDSANGAIATLAGARVDVTRDCAALLLSVPTTDEVLGLGVLTAATAPAVGMRVIKSGWKTGISEGRIAIVTGEEVVIERLQGYPMDYLLAGPGDSGAIWVDAATLAPVALHRRESGVGAHRAFATSLIPVLTALAVQQF